jgi:hypothetical protein
MGELEKEFVPYTESLALKELGFDEPCIGGYCTDGTFAKPDDELNSFRNRNRSGGEISAPLYQQAFRWFRKKYNLRASIMDFIDDEIGVNWDYEIAKIGTDLDKYGHYEALVDFSIDDKYRKFKTYEGAELACLKKLIKICRELNK